MTNSEVAAAAAAIEPAIVTAATATVLVQGCARCSVSKVRAATFEFPAAVPCSVEVDWRLRCC